MGPRTGVDGRECSSPPGFDPRPSSPKSVAIPTELPGPRIYAYICVYMSIYMCVCRYIYTRARFATLGIYETVEEENLSPYWESNRDIRIFQPRNIVTALIAVPELLR